MVEAQNNDTPRQLLQNLVPLSRDLPFYIRQKGIEWFGEHETL